MQKYIIRFNFYFNEVGFGSNSNQNTIVSTLSHKILSSIHFMTPKNLYKSLATSQMLVYIFNSSMKYANTLHCENKNKNLNLQCLCE